MRRRGRFAVGWSLVVALGGCGADGASPSPPRGTCDDLPAQGTWEDVTPPGTSSKPAVNGTVGVARMVVP